MTESLVDRTYRLLQESDLTYREIADRAGVGFEWLKSFSLGRRNNPAAWRVQRVHDFLASVPQKSPPRDVRSPMQSA